MRVFASFNDEEYAKVAEEAKRVGMSVSKFVEYATTLHIDMPRTGTPDVNQMKERIERYLERKDVDTFICSTPFADDWATMTTSAKRTAASQMRKLIDEGVIAKVEPKSKSHRATVYKKL